MSVGTTAAITLGAIGAGTSILGGVLGSGASKKAAGQLSTADYGAAKTALDAGQGGQQGIGSALTNARDLIPGAVAGAQSGVAKAVDIGQGLVDTGTGWANQYLSDTLAGTTAPIQPYMALGTSAANALAPGGKFQNFAFDPSKIADTPEYQFQLQQGMDAVNRAAAAKGQALGGGTLKGLSQYSQGLASTAYQQAYNNALNTFNTNRQTLFSALGFGQNAIGQNIQANQLFGTPQAQNLINNALYRSNLTNQGAQYEGNVGIQGANTLAGMGLNAAEAGANVGLSAADMYGRDVMGAGAAQAGGTVGSANAWNNALTGVGNAATGAYMMTQNPWAQSPSIYQQNPYIQYGPSPGNLPSSAVPPPMDYGNFGARGKFITHDQQIEVGEGGRPELVLPLDPATPPDQWNAFERLGAHLGERLGVRKQTSGNNAFAGNAYSDGGYDYTDPNKDPGVYPNSFGGFSAVPHFARGGVVPPEPEVPQPLVPGNIDLSNRPAVKNPDGTTSTVRTITIEDNGKTVLLPTVINGAIVPNPVAIKHYRDTGQHMGVFRSQADADAYDAALHNSMGWNAAPGSAQDVWQHGVPGMQQLNPRGIPPPIAPPPRVPGLAHGGVVIPQGGGLLPPRTAIGGNVAAADPTMSTGQVFDPRAAQPNTDTVQTTGGGPMDPRFMRPGVWMPNRIMMPGMMPNAFAAYQGRMAAPVNSPGLTLANNLGDRFGIGGGLGSGVPVNPAAPPPSFDPSAMMTNLPGSAPVQNNALAVPPVAAAPMVQPSAPVPVGTPAGAGGKMYWSPEQALTNMGLPVTPESIAAYSANAGGQPGAAPMAAPPPTASMAPGQAWGAQVQPGMLQAPAPGTTAPGQPMGPGYLGSMFGGLNNAIAAYIAQQQAKGGTPYVPPANGNVDPGMSAGLGYDPMTGLPIPGQPGRLVNKGGGAPVAPVGTGPGMARGGIGWGRRPTYSNAFTTNPYRM